MTAADFDCLSEGVFPDPSDCKKYYYCSLNEDNNFVADLYTCDNFYVFDPSAPNNDYCRLTMNRWCITANCQGSVKNILLNYPFFPSTSGQIVASCRGTLKPLIFRCEAGFLADLNTLPVECNLNCRGAGKYEYADDETKYLECVFSGRLWEPKLKSCFRNYYFNKQTKLCEPKPSTVAPRKIQKIF